MESSMFFGNTCQNGLMPALVRPTLPTVQTSLGMKPFLPIPLDTTSAARLFPGFNTMDPVQKAVLHHTLGIPPTAKRKHVSCSVCQLRFNSQVSHSNINSPQNQTPQRLNLLGCSARIAAALRCRSSVQSSVGDDAD
ncbi:zinc finger protein 385D-like isoform X1 [Poecilia latipinna]|uniref:zinc finger protein 385D-like isoform X1 n=2 Tax=Poecilia latipinna TaxID=48699 RepID=UPI00072DDDED|nr:PREDICTED: zinc finger protein 385D-like isoform X1 [Poecilia latipinna]